MNKQSQRRIGIFLGDSDVDMSGLFDLDIETAVRTEQPEGEALHTVLLVQILRELKQLVAIAGNSLDKSSTNP